VYRKPDHVGYVVEGGVAILMHLVTGAPVSLNEQGTATWLLLLETGTIDQTVLRLLSRFPSADPTIVERDIRSLVAELLAAELLEECP
jgi:hypothetical protein